MDDMNPNTDDTTTVGDDTTTPAAPPVDGNGDAGAGEGTTPEPSVEEPAAGEEPAVSSDEPTPAAE